jgi:tRNA (Thr-GGU) A37 N-methylase
MRIHLGLFRKRMRIMSTARIDTIEMKEIGRVSSWYHVKNGTPRQANICSHSRACIELNNDWFDNPSLALQDLDQFSHLW